MIEETELKDIIARINRKKIVGIVIDTIDGMMHGMVLGNAGMHQQVRLWIEKGQLINLIKNLLEAEGLP
jgi:predicted ATP-dependent serine protease